VKLKSRSIIILAILFGYVLLQFISWEIIFVRKTDQITDLKQKLIELSSSNPDVIQKEVASLHHKKNMQVIMIVGEGTVFLLLLLFGIYKIKQAQSKELELTNQQKNFFLSITHELKTPIAATKLQLQTLQKHQLEPEKQKELIGNALAETERLNSLIDNVLLASRLESAEYSFKKERHNISELTETIVNRYYKTQLSKNEIISDIEKNLFIETDAAAFPSIITNLLDNALKYSPSEKKVIVSVKKSGDQILLSVADSGIGISDADKKKIFTKFYRAGNEETRSSKGTGLGLYIVNYLAKKHNGDISVKDNQPKGSIFEIRFNAA